MDKREVAKSIMAFVETNILLEGRTADTRVTCTIYLRSCGTVVFFWSRCDEGVLKAFDWQ